MPEDATLTLYDSSKAFVQRALEFLATECSESEPEVLRGLREWVKRSDDMFTTRDRLFPPGARFLQAHSREVHSLTEYASFVAALRMSAAVAAQLDTLVGTALGARHVSIDEVVNRLVLLLAERVGGFRFDSVEFDKLFAQLLADLQRENFDYVAIAPLPLFKSEVTPIRLEDDLEIDRLTDTEISRSLNLNVPVGIDVGGLVHLPARCGIRHRFAETKRVGSWSDAPSDPKSAAARWAEQTERILDVVHALRAFKSGRISSHGVVRFSENWPVDGGTTSSGLEPGRGSQNNYSLTDEEAKALPAFWAAFRRARDIPFLDAAVRRFGYAGERYRPEDRLVDLMIAAEALFLSDAGEAKEKGEMRFRLSLRFAWFVEPAAPSRRARFRHVRSAYDARSALVHGGQPDADLLELPGEGQVTFIRFVEATEDILRAALRKAIETSPFSKVKLLDWDSVIFG